MNISSYRAALLSSAFLLSNASAEDFVDTNIKLSCAASGFYADGSRIRKATSEDISVEIRRINWNDKEPAKPPAWGSITNIKVQSNGKTYDGSLLRSSKDKIAFSFANDVTRHGVALTLALIYEIRLNSHGKKRQGRSFYI